MLVALGIGDYAMPGSSGRGTISRMTLPLFPDANYQLRRESPEVQREYVEGREAFERFRNAVKTVLSVPKSALPKTKKQAKRKPR